MASGKGPAYIAVGVGAVFIYTGIKGYSVLKSLQNLIRGGSPKSGQSTSSLTGGSTSSSGGSTSNYPTNSALEKLWTDNGGDPATAVIASQIAMAESGGNAKAQSSNPGGPGCVNVGIFQLATPCGVGGGHSISDLEDPNLNTQITIMATNNGINWSEWDDPVANALPNHQYTPQPSN